MVKVKICCIKSLQEADQAHLHGTSAIGLVGQMPSGPGIIGDKLISSIAEKMKDRVETFLLTSETCADHIIDHYGKARTSTIQLVDHVPFDQLEIVKKQLDTVKLIQVIHVIDESTLSEAQKVIPYVDALLLDSGNPKAKIKTLGGTGNTHNWDISKEIVASSSIPVYLAGGLNATNVRSAIEHVRPYGVDLCSGVRTDDQLDLKKLAAFFDEVRRT